MRRWSLGGSGQQSRGGAVLPPILFDQTLSGFASSIDTGTGLVPPGTRALQVFLSARTNKASAFDAAYLSFNGDTTTSNYKTHFVSIAGSMSTSDATTAPGIYLEISGNNDPTNRFGPIVLTINDPLGTKQRVAVGQGGHSDGFVQFYQGVYTGTSAVDRIVASCSPNSFFPGTRLTVVAV